MNNKPNNKSREERMNTILEKPSSMSQQFKEDMGTNPLHYKMNSTDVAYAIIELDSRLSALESKQHDTSNTTDLSYAIEVLEAAFTNDSTHAPGCTCLQSSTPVNKAQYIRSLVAAIQILTDAMKKETKEDGTK